MATKPGLLTEWPWQKLGNFKYVVLAPFMVRSLNMVMKAEEWTDVDLANLVIIPFLLLRMIHNQLWISVSRFQTARSKHRIVDKSIEFDQVDRERNWDDQIILNGLMFYIVNMYAKGAQHIPIWRTDGAILCSILHAGPVEFLYYWLHRALHHHYLYSRYHSHHHSSIVTEPITSVIHPFAEHLSYFALFSIPTMTMVYTGTASILSMAMYISYIDFMNNMGHCNFELIPMWLFDVFPSLKYLMYTPSFHSLHHTQFRTNYSLFMPFYDYIYGTMDKSTDELYESSLRGKEETPQVVHLTHPTSLLSIYYLRLGFASLASKPYASKWYMMLMWPITWLSMWITCSIESAFTVERNNLKKLQMQTWAVPRYTFQYSQPSERAAINRLIEKAITDAEERGVKVVTLGLLNQGEELNRGGEIFLEKNPKLKVRIVDGSSLAAAVVLNSIPQGTTRILLRGKPSKVASALALALIKRGIQVVMVDKEEFYEIKSHVPVEVENKLILAANYSTKVWIVGDGLMEKEQRKAEKGTIIIPFSQFPPRKLLRKDYCTYYNTPSMKVPMDFGNMHSCENGLPRRVMSAWRIAGIVHALEGWDDHECGRKMLDIDRVWDSAIRHGFSPLLGA